MSAPEKQTDEMDVTDDFREPIEVLASEYIDRLRQGESVSVEAYVAQYPDLASEIREFFPAMRALERVKESPSSSGSHPPQFARVEVPEHLGDLRIIRQIGRGGMGVVYEAEQESLGRRVAVKVLPRLGFGDERRQKRFQREAAAAGKLHHTNIVPVLGVGHHDGLHYYVMQLIRGVGLDEIIDRCREREISSRATRDETMPESSLRDESVGDALGTTGETNSLEDTDAPVSAPTDRSSLTDRVLDVLDGRQMRKSRVIEAVGMTGDLYRSVARVGLQAADALSYAHEMQTLHRDIKPANLIVDEHGTVWITDFGLAKIEDDDDFSQTGALVGTLRYMAPERLKGECDYRSDVYSLGLTLYELLAGQPAFDGDDRAQLMQSIAHGSYIPLRRLRAKVPRDLETIIHKSMATEPTRRYTTATEMADDLRRFLDGVPIRARRVGPIEKSWRWCQRNPAFAVLTFACVGLVFTVMTMAILGYFQSQRLLANEQQQRRVSEATNDLAVRTLDSIYKQFAPRRGDGIATESVLEEEGETIEVTSQPVISNESAKLLESLLPLYDRLAELDGGNDERFSRKTASAQRRIGDIRRQLGQRDEALVAYQACLEQLNQLLQLSPQDHWLKLELASVHNEIGTTQRDLNELDPAWREAHEAALTALASIPANQVEKGSKLFEEITYEKAKAHFHLGRANVPFRMAGFMPGPPGVGRGGPDRGGRGRPGFGERGRRNPGGRGEGGNERASSGEDANVVQEDREQRARDEGREPGQESRRRGRGRPFDRARGRGIDWETLSRQLLESLDTAIAESQSLIAMNANDAEYQLLLANCYRERSILRSSLRNREAAAEDLARSSELLTKLVDRYPDVPDYRFELSRTLATDSENLSFLDDESRPGQAATLNEAIRLTAQLVRQHPNVISYAEFLGLLYNRRAQVAARERNQAVLDDSIWSSMDTFLRLYERSPDQGSHLFYLGSATRLWLMQVNLRLWQMEAEAKAAAEAQVAEKGEVNAGEVVPAASETKDPGPIADRFAYDVDLGRMQSVVSVVEAFDDNRQIGRLMVLLPLYETMERASRAAGNAESATVYKEKSQRIGEEIETISQSADENTPYLRLLAFLRGRPEGRRPPDAGREQGESSENER